MSDVKRQVSRQPPSGAPQGRKRSLVGFNASADHDGFLVHIVDDAGETFEIEASRENIELMAMHLASILAERPAAGAVENSP
jgi:hypothetical protein